MSCPPSRCNFDKPAPAYAESGSGETVLLLHGSASSGTMWRRAMTALSPLYRAVAPDLSGYGMSAAWRVNEGYTVDNEARALQTLLPCGEAFHIVGHSFGGLVALQVAFENAARVRTLTLIEPVFFACLRNTGAHAAYEEFAALRARFEGDLRDNGPVSAMREFVTFWNGENAWASLTDAARDGLQAMAETVALDWVAAFAFDPPQEHLGAMAERTLIVSGDRSPRPMQILVNRLHGIMPGSAHRIVQGANHLLPVTHAPAAIDVILDRLRANAEQRRR
jgi:pimeloyl-ACP methyl ester carboxylesterase